MDKDDTLDPVSRAARDAIFEDMHDRIMHSPNLGERFYATLLRATIEILHDFAETNNKSKSDIAHMLTGLVHYMTTITTIYVDWFIEDEAKQDAIDMLANTLRREAQQSLQRSQAHRMELHDKSPEELTQIVRERFHAKWRARRS